MINEGFKGVGGVQIHASSWHPEGTKPKAIVVIAHGFNSHSGFYGWVAEQFVRSGFSVYALDHRGRGKSEGERYFINSVSEYVDDLATFITQAKTKQPGLPVYLLGHSAGGVISCTYTLDHQAELAGLICESFAFQVYAPDFALQVLKGISHVAPHLHVLKLPIPEFSRDPKVTQALLEDPQISTEVQPTQTVAELARADERLKANFSSITLPLLIIHGTADKVTKPEGSRFFYAQAGSVDKTLKLYEGYAHDPLNDLGKEVVLADVVNWIEERLPK